MMNNDQPVEIVLVEDNPGDVRLTFEVMKDTKVRNHMSIVKDGVEALEFLRRKGNYSDAPRPDLIKVNFIWPCWDAGASLSVER